MSTMHFQTRKEHAFAVLSHKGLERRSYAPPLHRLLWKLGVEIRPPHFMGFGAVVLSSGISFAVAWGLGMWLLVWSRSGASPLFSVVAPVLAGLIYGLTMAFIYSYQRDKLRLPEWDELGSVASLPR